MKRRILTVIISVFCIYVYFCTCGVFAFAETTGVNNAIALELDHKVYKMMNFGSNKYLTVDAGYDVNRQNVYQKVAENSNDVYGNQEFRFEYVSGSVRIHPICSSYGRHRVLDIVKQGDGTAGLISGCNVEIYAPTDDIAQIFNVTKVIVACEGEIRRVLSDDESERFVPGVTESETPNTVYVTCYRFTLKYNTSLALTAYGSGNGSTAGTSSTSAGNVIVATVDTSNYNQLWTLESSGVNSEENYYSGLSPTYPLSGYSYISSCYGNRDGGKHLGIDIPASEGTPLVSMFKGKVVEMSLVDLNTTYDSRGYYIVVESLQKYVIGSTTIKIKFVYMHLCELPQTTNSSLQFNSVIEAGTLIGKVGGTPNYQPHLHLAVIIDGADNITDGYSDTVNPMAFFANHAFTFNNY